MVACNRGKIMQKCKKRMALIMVFALCFGLSACGGGGSDNNDTVENEDDRCSDGSESDIYDSTDTVQYMASMESDSDNTVAEGYWYPDGNRNSLTYIKIQRDTLYWYEFNPEQGDVQVGEADGIVFKLGSKRRLKSGKTLTYTDTSKLNFEECKICFEDDAMEYYWRER